MYFPLRYGWDVSTSGRHDPLVDTPHTPRGKYWCIHLQNLVYLLCISIVHHLLIIRRRYGSFSFELEGTISLLVALFNLI